MKSFLKIFLFFLVLLFNSQPEIWAGYIEDADGKTVIHVKVFSLPDQEKPDPASKAAYAAIEAFKSKFPSIFAAKYRNKYKTNPGKYGKHNWDNVEIALERFTGIEVEGVETDLLAIAGGLAPDILYINFRKSDNYIQNGFLYPLDEYFATMTKDEIDFRINTRLWPVIKRKGSAGALHDWMMPYGGAMGKVLLYRKDLFDEAGLSYPDKNWTWDDLLNASKKITNPDKGIYGIFFKRDKYESWYWLSFLWSAGGDVMLYDEDKDQWKCVFDSKEAVVALDFYTQLCCEKWIDKEGKIRRGYSSKDSSEGSTKWNRGEIGMMFSDIDDKLFSTINPEITGICPIPKGPTGIRGGELNSQMMGLFSQIKEPAVRDAAWEYMFFYDSEEAVKIKTKIMVEGGLANFINPKYLRMFGYENLEYLVPKELIEIYEIAISTSKPEPYGKNSNVVYQLMTEPIQEAEQLSVSDNLPENKEARITVLKNILGRACERANEEMIGIITPEERLKRNVVAGIAIAVIIVIFCIAMWKMFKVFSAQASKFGTKFNAWNLKKYGWAYLLLLPALLTILIWSYIPLFRGSLIAFYDYRLIGNSIWTGFANFGDVIFNFYWWNALWNSIRYSFLLLSLTFIPPIILAIILQEIPKGSLFFRMVFYLPTVIAGIVTLLLWKQFFDPSEKGMLNAVMLKIPAIGYVFAGIILLLIALQFAGRLKFYGMYKSMSFFIIVGIILFFTCAKLALPILFPNAESIAAALPHIPGRLFSCPSEGFRWLSDPDTAMLSCIIPMVWAGIGPGCLIYLAALKGIPDDFYEAADIDGATFTDKIIFIVFPTLKILIIINFVGAFISSWNSAGNILVMTGGAANTEVAGLHIWYKAFAFLQIGPATAMGWMLGCMLVGFTIQQLSILSRIEFKPVKQGK